MTRDEFESRYRLLQTALRSDGAITHHALSPEGAVVMVHVLDGEPAASAALQRRFERASGAGDERIVEHLDVEGMSVVVTRFIMEFEGLDGWLPTDPGGDVPVGEADGGGTAADGQAEGGSVTGGPTEDGPGEFTRMFRAADLSESSPSPPAPPSPPPASTGDEPGEFTRQFGRMEPPEPTEPGGAGDAGARTGPPPAEAGGPPAPPPSPPGDGPGEFTRMFRAVGGSGDEPMPTEVDDGPASPDRSEAGAPRGTPGGVPSDPPSSRPPPPSPTPSPDEGPGEFTRQFGRVEPPAPAAPERPETPGPEGGGVPTPRYGSVDDVPTPMYGSPAGEPEPVFGSSEDISEPRYGAVDDVPTPSYDDTGRGPDSSPTPPEPRYFGGRGEDEEFDRPAPRSEEAPSASEPPTYAPVEDAYMDRLYGDPKSERTSPIPPPPPEAPRAPSGPGAYTRIIAGMRPPPSGLPDSVPTAPDSAPAPIDDAPKGSVTAFVVAILLIVLAAVALLVGVAVVG